jgi:hypothetical protein
MGADVQIAPKGMGRLELDQKSTATFGIKACAIDKPYDRDQRHNPRAGKLNPKALPSVHAALVIISVRNFSNLQTPFQLINQFKSF